MEVVTGLIALATALVGVWQTHLARQPQLGGNASVQAPAGAPQLATPAQGKLKAGTVLRDAGVIFLVTLILGMLIGVANSGSSLEELLPAIAITNILSLLVGFTIAAAAAPGNRWKHLAGVAAVIWALSIINVIIGVAPFESWILGIVLTAMCALVAGGISYIFRKA
jgi:hypothetical protein